MPHNQPDPRVNLSDAATVACRDVRLIVYPLDIETLGAALALDTDVFGTIVAPLSIEQIRTLAATCQAAADATPEHMAAMMAAMNDDKEQ